jgi:hypothetical protein
MYLSRGGILFEAGHESAGATAPATHWFFAEGATGPFFNTFVLIANVSPSADAVVRAQHSRIGCSSQGAQEASPARAS